MNKLIKILPLLATGVALVGCQDEDFGFEAKDIRYETEFRKAFGKIDPEQDWNAATRSEVTVSTSSASNIKIYALVDGEYSIVGDYSGVSGTQTLGFDCRKGVTEIMVTDGRMGQKTIVGGNVSFGAISRAANYGDNLSGTDISVSTTGRYINISQEESKAYADVIPEINSDSKSYSETNLPKVTKNFKYISNGAFSFYPMYWDTGGSDQIGIYYTDENGVEKEVIIYTPKSGDEFQNLTPNNLSINPTPADPINQSTVTEEQYINAIRDLTSYDLSYDELNGNYVIKYSGVTYIYETGHFTPGNGTSSTAYISCYKAENVTSTPSTAAYGWGTPAATQRSKEIVVDIPEGIEFGFFLVNGSYKFYSDASKNIDYPSRSGFPSGKASYAASIHINGQQYFCFEDWVNGDFDLNDLVFRFADPAPTVVDNDAVNSTWDVLCEDLGSTFDTDFNDIVIRVEYVSGRTTATVTPLAAGGTLADYLFFNGTHLGEIHQMFGATPAVSGQYEPINVGDERGTSGKQMAITVPTDWSMASYQADKWDTDAQISGKNMGGFQVFVLPEGAAANATNFGSASVIAAPAVGQIPEMICVPDQYSVIEERSGTQYKTKYYFSWAKELKSLSIAYNETDHKYSSWISDYASNSDWFKYPSGNIVERKQISSIVYDSEQGDDDGGNDEGGSTPGITIGSALSSQDAIYGYHYEITVTEGTFDTTKGGTITVTYASQPTENSYIATTTGSLVSSNNVSVTGGTFSVTLEAEKINLIKSGFWVGNYAGSQPAITSIVYTPAAD